MTGPVSATAPELAGRALLGHAWRDLAFLHWRVAPDVVAPLLPVGTRPDVLDGDAWVGLIPFRLVDATVGPSPPLPWVGSFAETNVRLYSVDATGRRGVVFRSLESERLAFVLGARMALRLPYTWSRMRVHRRGCDLAYTSRRRWPAPRGVSSRVVVRVGAPLEPDQLATFLTARWGLHTRRRGRTLFLPNHHAPWTLRSAELLALDDGLLAAAGLPDLASRAPDSVLFSDGVTTRFGAPVVVAEQASTTGSPNRARGL